MQRRHRAGLVDDIEQRLSVVTRQRRNLPLREQADREALSTHGLAGGGTPTALSVDLDDLPLTVGPPAQPVRYAIAHEFDADFGVFTQRTFTVAPLDSDTELLELLARLGLVAHAPDFVVTPVREPQGMHDGGLAGATSTDQCVVEGREFQRFRSAIWLMIAHVAGIGDFDAGDEMLRNSPRVEVAFVAATYRDAIAVK